LTAGALKGSRNLEPQIWKEENGMKKKLIRSSVWMVLVILGLFAIASMASDVPRITKEKLAGKLGQSDLVIIDVRLGTDWSGSELKIKGAVREDPREVNSWAGKYPKEKTLVFYCA
jgi:hypothetical protein